MKVKLGKWCKYRETKMSIEKLFKVEWNAEDSGLLFKSKIGQPSCTWSTRNLIAFTTGYTASNNIDRPCVSSIFVHIVCPETPWEVYHMKTHFNFPIEHLHWDKSSTRLLASDINGSCKVFAMHKNMINCWRSIHSVNFECRVVSISWLDPEPRVVFNTKASHANILEKFPKRNIKSCMADIAGLKSDGFIAITETGVAAIVLCEKGCKNLKIQKVRLLTSQCRVLQGDVCFREDGRVAIVLATDRRIVEFFMLHVKLASSKIDISVEISPCIVPHLISDDEYMTYHISCVKFSNERNTDKVLICTESGTMTCLKYFELKIDNATLQAVLQRMAQAPKVINIKEWVCSKSLMIRGQISCLAMSRMIISGHSQADSLISPSILLAMKQDMLVTASSNLTDVNTTTVSVQGESINALSYSPNDTCALAITENGNFAVFTAHSSSNIPQSLSIKTCVNLFEYCLITGSTPWDVTIFAAKHGEMFLEQCSQSVKNNLASQPSMTQERLSSLHSQIQAMIYKGIDGLYFGTNESYHFLMLKAIYCFIHSTMNAMPLEKESKVILKIKTTCSRVLDPDLSRILQVVDAKDLSFDSHLISTMQHLTQWIANYCIHICRLVLVSLKMGNSKQILSVISTHGLKMLREVLCIVYLWGQSCPGWQPHFLELGNPSDIISQIFKLVSKLYSKLMQSEYSKDVISEEEIPMRAHAMMYQSPNINDPKCGAICQCIYQTTDFDDYVFASEDDTMANGRNSTMMQPLEQGYSYANDSSKFFFDSLNHIQTSLMKGETLKQCIQCACLTLSITNPDRSLLASWKEQWSDVCYCGGFWRALDASRETTDQGIKESISIIEIKSE